MTKRLDRALDELGAEVRKLIARRKKLSELPDQNDAEVDSIQWVIDLLKRINQRHESAPHEPTALPNPTLRKI
jgi:hypothetical protein